VLTRNLSPKAQTAIHINTRNGFAKMHATAQIEGRNYTHVTGLAQALAANFAQKLDSKKAPSLGRSSYPFKD